MTADALAVMWKEWREWLLVRGNLRGGLAGMLITLAVFGVFLPLNTGRAWLDSPSTLLYWLWVPLLLVSNVVADAFAGERERHTLETLLASRLDDASILWGKVGAATGYAWGLSMLSVLLAVATINVATFRQGLAFYDIDVFVGIAVLSLLATLVAASAGVLVSLRAPSVRQAQQTLGIGMMLVLFVPLFGVRALPQSTQAALARLLSQASVWEAVAVGAVALLAVAAALLAAARARFRRSRLIAG